MRCRQGSESHPQEERERRISQKSQGREWLALGA